MTPRLDAVSRALLEYLKEGPKSEEELQEVMRTLVPVGAFYRQAVKRREYNRAQQGVTKPYRDDNDPGVVEMGLLSLTNNRIVSLVHQGLVVRHADGLIYLRDEGHSEHYRVDWRKPERVAIDDLLYERPATFEEIMAVASPHIDEYRALHFSQMRGYSPFGRRENRLVSGRRTLVRDLLNAATKSKSMEKEGEKYHLTEHGRETIERWRSGKYVRKYGGTTRP